jgi:hypothetical protein
MLSDVAITKPLSARRIGRSADARRSRPGEVAIRRVKTTVITVSPHTVSSRCQACRGTRRDGRSGERIGSAVSSQSTNHSGRNSCVMRSAAPDPGPHHVDPAASALGVSASDGSSQTVGTPASRATARRWTCRRTIAHSSSGIADGRWVEITAEGMRRYRTGVHSSAVCVCAASSAGKRSGSPRAIPHSVATPSTRTWRRAAARRAALPSMSSR